MSSEGVIRGRLFLLGAGFSAAAGIPLTTELLSQTMQLLKSEIPGLGSRVENYARSCSSVCDGPFDYSLLTLDDLCTFLHYVELRENAGGECWSELGCRELVVLRYYLAKQIALKTPTPTEIPTVYLDLAQELEPSDYIVSFNWDCLLERALLAVGKRYVYSGGPEDIVIVKPHGSLNWARLEHNDRAHLLEPLDWGDGAPRIGVIPGLAEQAEWPQWDGAGLVQPFIVLPGFGKALEVRVLSPLWYKPEKWFAFAHKTYIIGLSLREDDFFVRSMFLDNLQLIDPPDGDSRVHIVNPDPNARSNYAFALRSKLVVLHSEPFSKAHVDLIRGAT